MSRFVKSSVVESCFPPCQAYVVGLTSNVYILVMVYVSAGGDGDNDQFNTKKLTRQANSWPDQNQQEQGSECQRI